MYGKLVKSSSGKPFLSLNIVHQFYVGFRKVDKFFPLVFLALCIIFFLETIGSIISGFC